MDQYCKVHSERAESVNEQGQPICALCNQEALDIVNEYKAKKKYLLKKKQKNIEESLRQSKKKMVEVQETLELKMKSHLKNVEKYREKLLGLFAEQENKIDKYIDQEEDFVNFKKQDRLFLDKDSKDSTFKLIEEQNEMISQLEKEFQEILLSAQNQYTNSGQVQLMQETKTQIFEHFSYQAAFNFESPTENLSKLIFNRDNTILCYSDSYELKFKRITEDQLLTIQTNIEDDDMDLISCFLFGNQNNDIYYGNDKGKLKIFKYQDDKWLIAQTLSSHNGKEIVDLYLNENDTTIFSAGEDKSIRVWKKDLNIWKELNKIDNSELGQICSIAFDSISNLLISCSFTKIKLWDINNEKQLQVIDGLEPNRNNKLQFIYDRMFFLASQDQFYVYEKNDELQFQLVKIEILPQGRKYGYYNSRLQMIVLQNTESQLVEVLKFNGAKFILLCSVQGMFESARMSNDGAYLTFYKEADVKQLKIFKAIQENK